MNSLLKYLLENLSFLYGQFDFAFKNSVAEEENGNALLELQNDALLIQLIRDRGEISIYTASLQDKKVFFGLQELYEIIMHKETTNIPEAELIDFFHTNFSDIVKLLTENYAAALHKVNEIRAKQLVALGYKKYQS